jgi:lipoprotein NlpD
VLFKDSAYVLVWLLLPILLVACTTSREAPISSRSEEVKSEHKLQIREAKTEKKLAEKKPDQHVVKKGDTLYSIAWHYGFDYRDIAIWNNIKTPYVIYPGQQLKLQVPPSSRNKALTPGPIVRKEVVTIQETKPAIKPESGKIERQPSIKKIPNIQQTKPLPPGQIHWSWPVRGKLVKSNTPTAKKGIDIVGKLGQRVNAAAIGDVVYSGSGLLGYGKLIIIKHNDTFLSAYAHNSKLLVNEGDRVKKGQQIAQMGQTTDGRTLLHFEIRKNGKPIDPLGHLPTL